MPNPIPGPIPLATETTQGQVSTTQQTFGGEKLFPDGSASLFFDIRNYGAVSAGNNYDPTQGLVDCWPAFQAAIEAFTQYNLLYAVVSPACFVGAIYIPTGSWYVSRPIVFPSGCRVIGDGPLNSVVVVGGGDSAHPSLVRGFSGPMMLVTGPAPTDGSIPYQYPTYTAPLYGATGHSMVLAGRDPSTGDASPTLCLNNCFGMTMAPNYILQSCCLRYTVDLVSLAASVGQSYPRNYGMAGSRGPDCFYFQLPQDSFVNIYCQDTGSGVVFIANLTTRNQGLITLTSSTVTTGAIYNLELNYDGAHVWFYVNGVYQASAVATGVMRKVAWEQFNIGQMGCQEVSQFPSITGSIFSLEFASVARHTGAGGFSIPTGEYTGDSNTLVLVNFDPANNGPNDEPFVVGQAATVIADFATFNIGSGLPPLSGLNPFYMNFTMDQWHGPQGAYGCEFHDFQLACNANCAGLVGFGGSRTLVENIAISIPVSWGIKQTDPASFYWWLNNVSVSQAAGIGIGTQAATKNCSTTGCEIGGLLILGDHRQWDESAASNSTYSFVIGLGGSEFTAVLCEVISNDAEAGYYPDYRTACLVLPQTYPAIKLSNCTFDGSVPDVPPMTVSGFYSGPIGNMELDHCSLVQNQTKPTEAIHYDGSLSGWLTVRDSARPFNVYNQPWSYTSGWIVEETATQKNNQQGLSTTDVQANNISGTFTVLHGYTTGGPIFVNPEPDSNYQVIITPIGYSGSTPASGSTNVIGYTTSTGGFVATLAADPGGTCQIEFGYFLVRTSGAPPLFEYLPTVPSSVTNTLPTGNFAVGVTLLPVAGNVLPFYGGSPTFSETVVATGTTPDVLNSNGWEIFLYGQNSVGLLFSNAASYLDAFVANGQIYSTFSPGTHNVAFGWFNQVFTLYVDGGPFLVGGGNPGAQQTPIYIGQRYDASQPLTNATLRNLRGATLASQVITREPDSGPQAGNSVSAFFGDQMTVGYTCVTTTLGGFATQIASASYGSTFYHLACGHSSQTPALLGYWAEWGGLLNPTFSTITVMGGFNDLLAGQTSAQIMANLSQIFLGTEASATFTPPTAQVNAWVVYACPTSSSDVITINGTPITVTWQGSLSATSTFAINAINASGPLSGIVTAGSFFGEPGIVQVNAVAVGAAGNGIPVLSTNANGAYIWPQNYTFNGADTICVINGTTFIANFDTDATTTVNNLVALINGSALAALVTASNVSSQCFVQANSAGYAGNAITISGNAIAGGHWLIQGYSGTFSGGVLGAIGAGVPTMLFANIPPMGAATGYSAGVEVQRGLLNTAISTFCSANSLTLLDVATLLQKTGSPHLMNPIFLSADNTNPNDVGHTALFVYVAPQLPQGVGAPTALSYATNPASYAHGSPIASNNPSVTGVPTGYAVSPPLPVGLSLDPTTGYITGTPTTATAMATYTVMAFNATGATTVALVITIT